MERKINSRKICFPYGRQIFFVEKADTAGKNHGKNFLLPNA